MRYNGYPASDLIGDSDPKILSSGQVVTKLTEIADKVLPRGIVLEWTDLSYQQVTQSHAAAVVFPLAVMLAFLVLAARYESWTLPLAIILIVPVYMCAALLGVWLTGGDNNVFVQVGLVVLMGLAAHGHRRRTVITLPYFGAATRCIPGTKLILTAPRRFAGLEAESRKIKVLKAPGEITGFKYLMIWHPRVNTDAAHAWLRGEIRRIGKAIGS